MGAECSDGGYLSACSVFFKAMLYDQESIALTPLKRCFIGEEDILVRQEEGNRK